MRIALVSEFFYPTLGGVQEHLYNVAKQYIRKGHDTKIVTPAVFTDTPFVEWWPKDLPQSSYAPVGHSLPFFINGSRGRLCVGLGLGKQLKKLLSPENFDIVHLHAPLNGTLPIMAAHFASTYLVGTFHTSFPGSKSLNLFKAPAQKQLDKFDHILGVSPISLDSISQYLKLKHTNVIPNGIDTEVFKPLSETNEKKVPPLDDGRFNILFVGRPDPRNGLDTLILAFGRVLKAHPQARLVVVGGGEGIERYQAMASYLPKDSVLFMGALRDERAAVYRSADIHVFGVEKASFSVTLLEGMASGLPIVTTSFDGHLTHGVPGKHFQTTPYGDAEALANELILLMDNPEKRAQLSRDARLHAMDFDWSTVADRILDVYRDVMAERIPVLKKSTTSIGAAPLAWPRQTEIDTKG